MHVLIKKRLKIINRKIKYKIFEISSKERNLNYLINANIINKYMLIMMNELLKHFRKLLNELMLKFSFDIFTT